MYNYKLDISIHMLFKTELECVINGNAAMQHFLFVIGKPITTTSTNTNSQLSISLWPLALRMAVRVVLPRAPEWPAHLEQCDPQRNTPPHHSHTIAAENTARVSYCMKPTAQLPTIHDYSGTPLIMMPRG